MYSLLVIGTAHAAIPPSVTADLAKMSYKGINLGGSLDLPKEGTKIQQFFFDDYASNGFTHVRIPVCFYSQMVGGKVSSQYLSRVAEVTSWCLDRGLMCVLAMVQNKQCQALDETDMSTVWGQIAEQVASNNTRLSFDILAGPTSVLNHDALFTAGVTAVRSKAPKAICMISTKQNVPTALHSDPYLVGSFSFVSTNFTGSMEGNKTWGSVADKSAMATALDAGL